MLNPCITFKNLTTQQILNLFSEVLPKCPREMVGQLVVPKTNDGHHSLRFFFKEEKPSNQEKKLIELINNIYKQQSKNLAPIPFKEEPTGLTLPSAAIWLLLSDLGTQKPMAPSESEYMVIAPAGNELPYQYYKLCRHATHVRIANSSETGREDTVYFYVRHDDQRGSSFLSSIQDPLFQNSQLLRAYQVDEHVFFLPDLGRADRPHAYEEPSLRAFYRLCLAVPDLFDLYPDQSKTLFAIHPSNGPKRDYIWTPLSGLRFRDQLEVIPEEMLNAEIRMARPEPAEAAMRQFQDLLRKEHWAYYKLQLLPNPHKHYDDGYYQQLSHKIQQLEYEKELLLRKRQPRPLLFRYDHVDFQILAAFLRSLSTRKEVLSNGQLLYCCQGGNSASHGSRLIHYLWVDPSVYNNAPDPSLLFRVNGRQTCAFELDPFWEDQYHDTSNAYVFVPRHTTLYPTIHSFDAEHIDSYIDHLLGSQRQDCLPGEDGSCEEPIYLFDGTLGQGARLEITVLDKKHFAKPIVTMGWLNDCALVTTEDLSPFLRNSASQLTYGLATDGIGRDCRDAPGRFELMAQQVRNGFAKLSSILFADLEQEMARQLNKAASQAARIKKLGPRLDRFTGLASRHQSDYLECVKAHKKNKSAHFNLGERLLRAQTRAKKQLKLAQDAREVLARSIMDEINALTKARERVLAFLKKSLKPWGRDV